MNYKREIGRTMIRLLYVEGHGIGSKLFEYYEILLDGKHFAGFAEGDLSRFGKPMSYDEFMIEYQSCVSTWEGKGVESNRFSYRVYLEKKAIVMSSST